MTREVTVTLDKNDFVQDVTTTGSRWRFQRIRPMVRSSKRKLTEEQEQAICAMYVDRPNMSARRIAESFGIGDSAVSGVVASYGIPFRRPNPRKVKPQRAEKPDLGTRPSFPFAQAPGVAALVSAVCDPNPPVDPRPVWRVTVVQTVVEEIHADNLLDIAAIYDGTDVQVTKVERT